MMGTEGTPMGSSSGGTTRVTFDAINEKELLVPVGEPTSAILVQAHPDNNQNAFIMLDKDTDQAEALILEPGALISFTLDVSSNPVYAEVVDTADTLKVGWLS